MAVRLRSHRCHHRSGRFAGLRNCPGGHAHADSATAGSRAGQAGRCHERQRALIAARYRAVPTFRRRGDAAATAVVIRPHSQRQNSPVNGIARDIALGFSCAALAVFCVAMIWAGIAIHFVVDPLPSRARHRARHRRQPG